VAGVVDLPERVVRDFPDEPVGVSEIARVTAPEGLVGGLEDLCACALHFFERAIDGLAVAAIVRERDAAEASAIGDLASSTSAARLHNASTRPSQSMKVTSSLLPGAAAKRRPSR
jgi:hypothetical protein